MRERVNERKCEKEREREKEGGEKARRGERGRGLIFCNTNTEVDVGFTA